MQRLLAFLLLAVFGFWTAAPLMMADPSDLSLPACCRRNGLHHCSMSRRCGAQDQGPALRNIAAVCPYCPQTGVSCDYTRTVLPAPARTFFAEVLSHPAVRPQSEAQHRISFARSCQKRGPPSFLLHS